MSKKNINRILLKLSGEALMGDDSYGIKLSIVERIASDIKTLSKKNIDICIVIGGGNIFRGLSASSEGMDRAQADYMGMLATVLNSLACENALEKMKVDTRVMSALPIQAICETDLRRRAIRHLSNGRDVIWESGTGKTTC